MNELIKLEVLRLKRNDLLAFSKDLPSRQLVELRQVRTELLRLLVSLDGWRSALRTGQFVLSHQDRLFIQSFFREIDELEIAVSTLISERDRESSLREEWESLLLPEVRTGISVSPKYPARASFQNPNLISLMDDTWLPVDRQSGKRSFSLGVAR